MPRQQGALKKAFSPFQYRQDHIENSPALCLSLQKEETTNVCKNTYEAFSCVLVSKKGV